MTRKYNKDTTRFNKIVLFFIVFFSVFLCPLYSNNLNPSVTLHRFAMIIGSNNGGKERVMLRYAAKDALSFAQVMKDMGAVYAENMIVLLDPRKDQILSGFKEMKKMVSLYTGTPGRKEFIIYYSGHSDEEGLLLFGEMFTYKQFRDEISGIKAEVRVAILDSCSSGAFTRTKGVIRQPSFLIDSSSEMKGYAFLTSSSEDESAQESDSIKASFFTHYFVSGLRGAADTSNDGMVTLYEAYSHAFSETLARTERTQYGPQHPMHDIQLTGKGELVLTDLRETSASLLLANELEGRLFIRDKSGNLVVELRKIRGNSVEIGLEPGKYDITLDQKDNLLKGFISLKKNDRKFLSSTNLKKITGEEVIARGDDNITEEITENNADQNRQSVPFHYSLFPSFFEPGFLDPAYSYTTSLNLLIGTASNIDWIQVSSVGNIVIFNMHGGQGAGIFNFVGEDMSGIQVSGIGNIVAGKISGVQVGGIFNFSAGDSQFVQGAGIINLTAGSMKGFQGAGIISVAAGELNGFQVGGIANFASSVAGTQISGIVNISDGAMKGFQGVGIANVAGIVSGAQIAGIGNFADTVSGTQIAGILNISGEIKGFQSGLINIAGKVSGVQLGLFNFAEEFTHGFPIGLVSIENNGCFYFDFWHDEAGYTHVGVRFGTRYTYALITSAMVLDSDPILWSYGVGWGIHIPLSIFAFDADITCNSMNIGENMWYIDDQINLLPRVRGSLGINIGDFITIFGGYSFDVYLPWLYYEFDPDNCLELDYFDMEENIYVKPEFFAGVSFHL